MTPFTKKKKKSSPNKKGEIERVKRAERGDGKGETGWGGKSNQREG